MVQVEKYALTDDTKFGKIAASNAPTKWSKSTCGYCGVGCGLYVGSKDGKVIATKGDPAHPVSRGTLCPKGLSQHQMVQSDNRFETISSCDSRSIVASKTRRI